MGNLQLIIVNVFTGNINTTFNIDVSNSLTTPRKLSIEEEIKDLANDI
ncbi:MAG: hypothetical protein N4A64_12895 [Marinisporobacter sp.]|jgi:hypothetical protein|nr:hypothetical protein [Marinisporobacter sp.]